ncbi:hypothetical protein HDV03_005548 [Kappamyces sp. JEL0829]|nr:hypothetical protein HDV03_005548 [Kappamyces sp. JEL0829]
MPLPTKSLEAGNYQPLSHPTVAKGTTPTMAKVVLALLSIGAVAALWDWPHLPEWPSAPAPKVAGSADRVLEDLKHLQQIALEHGSSRSVINGHKASVKYVVDEIGKLSSWKVWTEDVPVKVQVDEEEPVLSLLAGKHVNRTFHPRLEVATASGSGSVRVFGAPLVIVDSCSFSYKDNRDWVAVIDGTHGITPSCSACDRMVDAIREGAKGVIFINKPGNQAGYPQALPPSPGRCGRNPVYVDAMKGIGAVSLGDAAAFDFLSTLAAHPRKATVDLEVVSTFREYISKNVLADTIEGDDDSVILFGSHLDGVPAGPGVNDDGSGAMATLELARAWTESGLEPKQKIRLAWWTAEEIGLVGSRYYVDHLAKTKPEELAKIKMSLDNDMLASPNFIRGVYDGQSVADPALRVGCVAIQQFFKKHFESKGLATAPGAFDGRSDYQAFMDHGIPSGGLFTGADKVKTPEEAALFGGVIGVAQDPCYHQDCDRVEQLKGPGMQILRENMAALSQALEVYATGDLDQLLHPDSE